jgi:glycosyltransferase involved in cell wall biosynthesis
MIKKINRSYKKKVALFTNGYPDPTQGGSGIFNYYVLLELIKRGYKVDAYFKYSSIFFSTKINQKYFSKFRKKINKIYFVKDFFFNKFYYIFLFGSFLLKYLHGYKICKEFIQKVPRKYDAYISLDLGWALSLKDFSNCLCVLGDPKHLTLLEQNKNIKSLKSIFHCIKAKTMGSRIALSKIGQELKSKKIIVGSFSRHHADEYSRKGLKCQSLEWFSPEVKISDIKLKKKINFNNSIKFLHVGDLTTTGSKKDDLYNFDDICKILIKKKRDIEFKFVGRYQKMDQSNFDSIKFIYTGYVKSLTKVFNSSDIFLYLKKYSVGTRTRILTAMSYGMPVIADVSVKLGLHRLKNKFNIFLIKDLNEFSKVIDDLIINPDILKKISINARNTWEKYYNPKKNVPLLLNKINL